MRKILVQIGIPTLLASICIVVDGFLPAVQLFHPYKWGLIAFFVILTLVTTGLSEYGLKSGKEFFSNFYMLSILVRMFLSIIFIFILILADAENPFLLVIDFFILYFFYIVFEIYFLLGNLRANSKNSIK